MSGSNLLRPIVRREGSLLAIHICRVCLRIDCEYVPKIFDFDKSEMSRSDDDLTIRSVRGIRGCRRDSIQSTIIGFGKRQLVLRRAPNVGEVIFNFKLNFNIRNVFFDLSDAQGSSFPLVLESRQIFCAVLPLLRYVLAGVMGCACGSRVEGEGPRG